MFSVIIPVHNNRPHLKRSIESVLSQTFSDFELIIVDDASKDFSYEEILTFTDPRIKVFRRNQPGPGGYGARNLGIRKATRDWVCFLDADDEWMPSHLEQKKYLMESHPEEEIFSCGWVDSWDEDTRDECRAYKNYRGKDAQRFDFLGYIDKSINAISLINTNVVTVKKQLIQAVGGFPEGKCKRGGDVTTYLNLILKKNSLLFGDFLGAVYHKEDSYVTRTFRPEVTQNCIQREVMHLLEKDFSADTKHALKRFSNFHLTFGLVAASQAGELCTSDLAYYFKTADNTYRLLYLLSLLPGRLQKKVWAIYHKVKK